MKYFFKKIMIFSVGVIIFLVFYISSFNVGYMDFYYKRISSPLQQSLILGTSTSAQSLVPYVFNEILSAPDKTPFMFNFSFAANYSPYGQVYLNSIVKKVDPNTRNGVFILSVDPRSISIIDNYPVTDNISFLAHIKSVTANPNFDYILYSHEVFYKKIFLNMITGRGYLHDDGWLEMRIKSDSIDVENRIRSANNDAYRNYLISEERLFYLKRTIEFLKNHGKVYLITLPLDKRFEQRIQESVPHFKTLIEDISNDYNVPYLNFIGQSQNYKFTDGTHLTSESAKEISRDIANWIKKQNNN